MMGRLVLALIVVISVLCGVGARIVVDNGDYTIWRIPDDADTDATGIVTGAPGVALIGGGSDCNQAFAYMIENANGGDFVVLRASQSDGYNDYVYKLSQSMNKTLNSVTTVLFKNREAASAAEPLSYINSAELVFFAGGDQGRYLNFWADTPVQSAVQNKINNGITIGGTSAGLAIMATRVYTAVTGSAYSDECLENPYNLYSTFGSQFLKIPNFSNIITDTHFGARDRMGRMLSFLARTQVDYNDVNYRALGVDEQTALLYDVHSGMAKTVGVGNAYMCSSPAMPVTCVEGQALNVNEFDCQRLSSRLSDTYDFVNFRGSGVNYTLKVADGKIIGYPYGPQ